MLARDDFGNRVDRVCPDLCRRRLCCTLNYRFESWGWRVPFLVGLAIGRRKAFHVPSEPATSGVKRLRRSAAGRGLNLLSIANM
jgi:hypothetical protein